MDVELKPCPFCGGKAELRVTYNSVLGDAVHVACESCGVKVGKWRCGTAYDKNYEAKVRAAEKLAADAWNRRADDEHDA